MSETPQFAQETIPVAIEDEMRRSYLDYAMSVIVGRALPDVRDGLKPVHRRVLYGMHEINNVWNRSYVKCARIVGEVMGKYHPHGDSAIYDALVRMAQDFSLRAPLIDGQGNFGSIDGDNAAAMRYTECRMERIASELMADLDKETVDFGPNYDGKELEPLVLPTRFPNLLVNGSSGIAVGMATNIPPHNLGETINACLALLDDPELGIDELIEHMPAPDFPTAGIIFGTSGVREGYRTGRGRVVIRARTHLEPIGKSDREAIIVDELPYQVNKAKLLERIVELVRGKQIDGISEVRDESDKDGMRVVIELKRGEFPDVVLNNLFKHTPLQDSFGINMVALVHNQPKLLNLKQVLECFLTHRREVVIRRTLFELRKARERGHVLEGLAVALSNVDEIIALIEASPTPDVARQRLMSQSWASDLVTNMLQRAIADTHAFPPEGLSPEFGLSPEGYRLSEAQAKAILELRLQRLTGLEQDKIVEEYRQVVDIIADLLDLLAKPERITALIRQELEEIKTQYTTPRRSEVVPFGDDISLEDLITPQDMVVTLSHAGYTKAQPLDEYRAQRRGGRGKLATATRENDFIDQLFIAHTHDYILCFSSRGQVYWLKVYEMPQGGRNSRGKPIVNLLPLQEGEKINAILPIKHFSEDHYVFMATQRGIVKKTPLTDFSRPLKKGIIAVELQEDDRLVAVALTNGQQQVMLFSSAGKAVRFNEQDVRPMGRVSRGVRGMMLHDDAELIALLVADDDTAQVLTASDGGYGKRTLISEYRHTSRGTQGVIAMDLTDKTGLRLIGACLVHPQDGLMLITDGGVLIRTRVSEVRETGRSAQGVRLINLDGQERLCGLQRLIESDETDPDGSEPDESEPDEAGSVEAGPDEADA